MAKEIRRALHQQPARWPVPYHTVYPSLACLGAASRAVRRLSDACWRAGPIRQLAYVPTRTRRPQPKLSKPQNIRAPGLRVGSVYQGEGPSTVGALDTFADPPISHRSTNCQGLFKRALVGQHPNGGVLDAFEEVRPLLGRVIPYGCDVVVERGVRGPGHVVVYMYVCCQQNVTVKVGMERCTWLRRLGFQAGATTGGAPLACGHGA